MFAPGEVTSDRLPDNLPVAYLITALSFMFISVTPVFVIAALTALLLFGYIGGFTHYVAALFLFGRSCSGKVIGIAIALATLLQFVVQNLFVTDIALIVSLLLSVGGILYLVMRPVRDWMFENPLPYDTTPSVATRSLVLPVCVVAVMSMCCGLGDGIVTQLHASGAVNLISYSRLLYALGALLAGIVADMASRRLLPLCTLCVLVFSSTMLLFIGEGNAAMIYVGALYLTGGLYVMYLTITFLDAAPMTDRPDLWAGMGRVVRGVFIGLTVAVSNFLFESVGQQGIVIIGVCLSLLVLVLFVAGGGLNIRAERKDLPKDRMPEFISAYKLTPREADVLEWLLGSEDTNSKIASELAISVRVLQRYIASIYEKTGVQSRVGLVKLYYNK